MRKTYDFSKAKRGAIIKAPGKTRITIMLDSDLIDFFRNKGERQGVGYQTLINRALRRAIDSNTSTSDTDSPLTAAELRRVLREELKVG